VNDGILSLIQDRPLTPDPEKLPVLTAIVDHFERIEGVRVVDD
jgi:hypothetical protein